MVINLKDPGSRLLRWRLKLEEYDYKIEYKRGKMNSNADALSRIHTNHFTINEINATTVSYSDFLNALQNTVLTYNKIEEYKDYLLSSTDNYAVCISKNLEMNDSILSEFKIRFNQINELQSPNAQLHGVLSFPNKDKTIYYLIVKEIF